MKHFFLKQLIFYFFTTLIFNPTLFCKELPEHFFILNNPITLFMCKKKKSFILKKKEKVQEIALPTDTTSTESNTVIYRDTMMDGELAIIPGPGNARIDFSATESSSIGINSLDSNTTGTNNTALGYESLLNNTEGSNNTAVGSHALGANTTASNNIAFGDNALVTNNGNNNTALGTNTLNNLLTGTDNIALGESSGSNYTGSESNTITIGNTGITSDSGTIRIGTSGTHNTSYLTGETDIILDHSTTTLRRSAIGTNQTSSNDRNFRIICGKVSSNGTKLNFGTYDSFTSSRTGTGAYTITFDEPFAQAPVITATASDNNTAANITADATTSNATIRIINIGSGLGVNSNRDEDFYFTVIGQNHS